MLDGLSDVLKGLAKKPVYALLGLVFIMQAYVMINQLNSINDTLLKIHEAELTTHEDNVVIREYIVDENLSTLRYLEGIDEIEDKIDLLIAFQAKGGDSNEN